MSDPSQQPYQPLAAKLDKEYLANSLPYYDGILTKEQKQIANELIDEEIKRSPKVKNYLADFPTESDRWLTPAMKEMLKMVENNQPLDAIDEARYGVPDMETLEKKDPQDLLKLMELFEAQLMYAEQRRLQLNMLQKHGPGAYRQESTALKAAADNISRKATELKKETFDIHRERKTTQAEIGKTIKELEDEWQTEVEKVNALRDAIEHAKQQLEKSSKEIENIEN
uniref:Pre-mRNA-splicing factor SPF27 n=2 Tax=Panagrolaimus sp. PS1159 TaxID=55785 RepID=A0AC35ETS7_9BILA